MRNIILISSYILLFGCTSQEEKKKQEEELPEQHQADEKEKVISNLAKKYNITYKWDTLNYDYSINYRPVIETKYQLIADIEVIDIYTKDSREFVSLKSGLYPTFYFDFPISKEQENKFLNGDGLILIVSIDEIRKLRFELAGEIEDSESARVNLDISTAFIGKGKIIEIVSTTK
jgi:hypothetical protein